MRGDRHILARTKLMKRTFLLALWLAGSTSASEPAVTLPLSQRPEWLRRDGIVMAGSWEPLLFRVRRDGGSGYQPSPQQIEDYHREQSPEMIAQLKKLGVNFVMMHCYKGGGLETERESMADAVVFARRCHEAGLKVGVYDYSGAFIWELFFKEKPKAEDWVLHNADGSPITYGRANYRYYFNRNHPDAQVFYHQLVRFAIEDVHTDLIHFDNYHFGPSHDANSIQRFRQYLQTTFSPAQLKDNGIDSASVQPPTKGPKDLLGRAWADFCCQSLADAYGEMGHYARTLRPDILMECNPAGVRSTITPPVDHGRLLRGGEALWDESAKPAYANGKLTGRLRTYKVARRMNNSMFAYVTSPLEAAESLAFNLDCLGAICWFEYGKIVARPGQTEPMSEAILPYVRFFNRHRDLLAEARVVSDVAVIRSFPSMVFGDKTSAALPGQVEDALALHRRPFQILYEPQLDLLSEYQVAVLAGCAAMGDQQIEQIRRYVKGGGHLCVIGPLATHDQWMLPRSKPALEDLPADKVVRCETNGNWLSAIDQARGGPAPVSIHAKTLSSDKAKVTLPFPLPDAPGLCCELTEQPARRLLHLINYRNDGPINDVAVTTQLGAGKHAKTVRLFVPDQEAEQKLSFEAKPGSVQFTIPQIGIYALVAVDVD